MDGYELCKRIREESSVPIVMITGYGIGEEDEDKVRALRSGADAFLNKPFDVDEFLSQVAALLAKCATQSGG